jgi:integrase/recombinase XerD
VRRYQLHLTASGVGVPTINQTISTLRFFFKVTLGRPDLVERAIGLSPVQMGALPSGP